MYYRIDEKGYYLGVQSSENQNWEFQTDVEMPTNFRLPKFENNKWIDEYMPEAPELITRRQFKIALAVLGKNEQDILNGISQLPEPNKTIAMISYTEAGTFERNNPELIFVAKTFLQMTDDQIDEVFIIGNNY